MRSLNIHRWGTTIPGGALVQAEIITNLDLLYDLINSLDDINMELVGVNEAGIIIDYKDDRAFDRITEINTQLDTIKHQIQVLDINFMDQDTRVEVLEGKNEKITIKDSPENDNTGEALYLMWDLLPDELKKKLTIYIKKL